MLFGRKPTEPPPITDEPKYVAWFIEHSDELAGLRALNAHNLPAFVGACARGAMKEVSSLQSGDAMFERAGNLAVAYETQIKPLVEKRGGLQKCPGELYGAAAGMLVNIAVLCELLQKKYRHPEALKVLGTVKGAL